MDNKINNRDMNKLMLKMVGLDSIKPITGTVVLEVNGQKHDVNFDNGKLHIVGPHAQKLGKALEFVGAKLTLTAKGENSRTYNVKED